MKLLVYNIPNTLNYGSMMMAESLFYRLAKEYSGDRIEFLVVTPKAEETCTRLYEAVGKETKNVTMKAVHPREVIAGKKIGKLLSKLTGIDLKNKLHPDVQDVDGVVVLGGDDFTEDYGYIGPILALLTFRCFNKIGKKVIMCGQTIGPFYSWRKPVVKHLLKYVTQIIARDPITYRYLSEDFKLNNVTLAADLAFLPLARESESQDVKPSDEYFTIVPSELIWKYAREKDREKYLQVLTNVAAYILEQWPDSKLLILPHVLAPETVDDTLAGRDLFIKLKRKGVDSSRIIFEQRQLLPYQARQLLSGSRLVVTGRMHAAISSLESGVPAVSLSYSRKYWGIIGEYLGMKNFIVDVRDKTWDEIEINVLQQLEKAEKQYASLREEIRIKVNAMQRKALEGIRTTAKLLLAK